MADLSQRCSPSAPIVGIEKPEFDVPDHVSCADEPIRVPGSIQPHGFLLGVNRGQEQVVLASENVESFLNHPLKLVLGSPIDRFLSPELLASIRGIPHQSDLTGLVTYLGSTQIDANLFSVLTHCIGTQRILEFELQNRLVGPDMMNAVMTNFVALLSRLDGEASVCEAITQQVSELTGFDRVLLYRFDEAGHGTVLAEANKGVLPSYLDLRFPASDIPVQARALYIQNTVRIIPDAVYAPVPLQGVVGEDAKALDMSLCVLRSVSPVHLQYMRNMGTMSSMSISILCEGKLWGLISGHHSQPLLVPFLIRSACDLLAKMVGSQLATLQTASKLRTLVKLHDVQRLLLTQIAAENDYIGSMSSQLSSLIDITDSDGVVLAVEGDIQSAGITPTTQKVRELISWLNDQPQLEVLHTEHLSSLLPWAESISATASGLLAIRISDLRQRYILWFRKEVVLTVKWAGEPVKEADDNKQLHPRTSFSSWKETLHGQSVPWSEAEIESALKFRSALSKISLRRAEEEAQLRHELLKVTLQSIGDGVITTDAAGTVVWLNPAAERMTGWSAAEAMGQPISEIFCIVNEETQVPVENPVLVCLASREAAKLDSDSLLIARDGRRSGIDESAAPIRGALGELLGAVLVFHDVTEQRRLYAETSRLAKVELKLKDDFLSRVSHELRAPLSCIYSFGTLISDNLAGETTPAQQEYIQIMLRNVKQLQSMIEDLLTVTRANEGKLSIEPQKVSIAEPVVDALHTIQGPAKRKQIKLSSFLPEDLPMAFTDAKRILQVLIILLDNAVKFTPEGGAISVRVSVAEPGFLLVEVADTGCGIPPEKRARVFEHLYQIDDEHRQDTGQDARNGLGLGLHIAQDLVIRQGGRIWISSAEGHGSVFSFTVTIFSEDPGSSQGQYPSNRLKDAMKG